MLLLNVSIQLTVSYKKFLKFLILYNSLTFDSSFTCDTVIHAEGHVVGVGVLEGVEIDLIVQYGLDTRV
jgi:hypothetical protein